MRKMRRNGGSTSDILERKSQRLKVSYRGSFEISKATSKSVTLHFMDLDIIGLLEQVELEYDRDIKAADLAYPLESAGREGDP